MNLQENIRRILREETSFMDKMRNLFAKDKPTPDDKLIDLIVDYIRLSFDIIETELAENIYTHLMGILLCHILKNIKHYTTGGILEKIYTITYLMIDYYI